MENDPKRPVHPVDKYFALLRAAGVLRVAKHDDLAGPCSVGKENVLVRRHLQKARPLKSGSKQDRKSTRLNSSHQIISYAVFCLKKKNNNVRIENIAGCNTTPTKN